MLLQSTWHGEALWANRPVSWPAALKKELKEKKKHNRKGLSFLLASHNVSSCSAGNLLDKVWHPGHLFQFLFTLCLWGLWCTHGSVSSLSRGTCARIRPALVMFPDGVAAQLAHVDRNLPQQQSRPEVMLAQTGCVCTHIHRRPSCAHA